jgi:3-deoxy-manno-octulosonate cytidylyltransferase (CMP-KDO synthetase)
VAVLTDPDLPSGSDRILAALAQLDPDFEHDVVINLQGDMPFVDPAVLSDCARILKEFDDADIATVVAPEASPADRSNPDVVKAVLAMEDDGMSGRALYFTRSTLYGDAPDVAPYRHLRLSPRGAGGVQRRRAVRPSKSARSWNNCAPWSWA